MYIHGIVGSISSYQPRFHLKPKEFPVIESRIASEKKLRALAMTSLREQEKLMTAHMQALKGNWLVECNIFTSIVTILYYDR
jgi:hypothetical protein